MRRISRLLILALLVPPLLTSVPAAQADFLVANPAPESSNAPARWGVDGEGRQGIVPIVFDKSRKIGPDLAGEEDGPREGDWRESLIASYGLFLLTLIGGHYTPPAPQPSNTGTVISSNSGGGGGTGDPQSNPEPATLVSGLVGGTLMALVYLRKRRSRHQPQSV